MLLFVMLFSGCAGDLACLVCLALLVVQLFCACVLLLVWVCRLVCGYWRCYGGFVLYCCLVSYCFVLASIDGCGYCCLLYLL